MSHFPPPICYAGSRIKSTGAARCEAVAALFVLPNNGKDETGQNMRKGSRRRTERVSDLKATELDGSQRDKSRDPKRRGELGELAFMHKAASLGFGVAKPYGDSFAYDFVIDSGTRLWRVQVKSTYSHHGRGYYLNVKHAAVDGTLHYTKDEIDMLVAYVAPAETWYVLPVLAVLDRRQVCVYPHGCRRDGGRFELYREAWHLLRVP